MTRVLLFWLVLFGVVGACGFGADDATTIVAQSDEPGPVRLAPPNSAGRAKVELVVQIDVGTFAARWGDAQDIAERFAGVVTEAAFGVMEEGGDRFSFGTVTMEVPTGLVDAAVDTLASLGSLVSSNFVQVPPSQATSTIVATITESPSAVARVDAPPGRVTAALDTAGEILLTMVAIAIVAGAVVIPLGLVVIVGLVMWQRISGRKGVAASSARSEPDEESEQTSVGV